MPSDFIGSFVCCFILLIPLLYYSNWDHELFLRKATDNEIIFTVLLFIGYIIFALTVSAILDAVISPPAMTAEMRGITVESTISLIFLMMADELVKFITLMFLMRVIYKYTSNRKLALVVSSIIVLTGFSLLYYEPPYTPLLAAFLIQGVGGIFELYGYLKTKNIMVPYISHLLVYGLTFLFFLWAPA